MVFLSKDRNLLSLHDPPAREHHLMLHRSQGRPYMQPKWHPRQSILYILEFSAPLSTRTPCDITVNPPLSPNSEPAKNCARTELFVIEFYFYYYADDVVISIQLQTSIGH